MATLRAYLRTADDARPLGRGFDWVAVAAAAWPVIGAHLDVWAHGHIPGLETFVTPWHAMLYSGLVASSIVLGIPWLRGILPAGYGLALGGCALFAVGGVLDMLWHLAFGIERGTAGLLSPTHLLLMLSGGLISTGALRAAWFREGSSRAPVTALLSATLVLSMLTFATEYDHPWNEQYAQIDWIGRDPELSLRLGFLGVVVQSAFIVAVLATLLKRFELPFGAITLVVGLNSFFVTLVHHADPVVLVAIVGGLGGDLLLLALRRHLQAWAFAFPALLFAIYFAALARVDAVWWEPHDVAGAVIAAGLAGWLVAVLAGLPWARPEKEA